MCFLKDTLRFACSHVDGGLLCSNSGLHGIACFVDALHKEAGDGDRNCEELQELLSTTGAFNDLLRHEAFDRASFNLGTADIEAETARMGSLLHAIAEAGNIFRHDSPLYSMFMDMAENDERIVWTNDQSLEAGTYRSNGRQSFSSGRSSPLTPHTSFALHRMCLHHRRVPQETTRDCYFSRHENAERCHA